MNKLILSITILGVTGVLYQTLVSSSAPILSEEYPPSEKRAARSLTALDSAESTPTLKPGGSLNATQVFGAAESGSWRQVMDYLRAGGDPNITDEEGRSLLFWAALSGETEVLRALLHAGAQLEHKDRDGRTPLMAATLQSQTEALALLIEAGALVDATTDIGQSAVHMAVEVSNSASLDQLVSAGADIAAKFGELEMDSYLLATNNGDFRMMDELIKRYPGFVDSTDREGRTASHYTCAEGDIASTARVLRHGGRLDRPDRSGRDAFAYALDQGSDACQAFVEEAGLSEYL